MELYSLLADEINRDLSNLSGSNLIDISKCKNNQLHVRESC